MSAKALYWLSKGINVNKVYKQIEQLIEQHDKITVVFAEPYYGEECKYNLRKRILTKSGDSRVAYKSHGYDKYSGFSASCFLGNRTFFNLNGYKRTLQQMKEHDGQRIIPVAIWYGPNDANKIAFGKRWDYVNETTRVKNLWHRFLRMWFN